MHFLLNGKIYIVNQSNIINYLPGMVFDNAGSTLKLKKGHVFISSLFKRVNKRGFKK